MIIKSSHIGLLKDTNRLFSPNIYGVKCTILILHRKFVCSLRCKMRILLSNP